MAEMSAAQEEEGGGCKERGEEGSATADARGRNCGGWSGYARSGEGRREK